MLLEDYDGQGQQHTVDWSYKEMSTYINLLGDRRRTRPGNTEPRTSLVGVLETSDSVLFPMLWFCQEKSSFPMVMETGLGRELPEERVLSAARNYRRHQDYVYV